MPGRAINTRTHTHKLPIYQQTFSLAPQQQWHLVGCKNPRSCQVVWGWVLRSLWGSFEVPHPTTHQPIHPTTNQPNDDDQTQKTDFAFKANVRGKLLIRKQVRSAGKWLGSSSGKYGNYAREYFIMCMRSTHVHCTYRCTERKSMTPKCM